MGEKNGQLSYWCEKNCQRDSSAGTKLLQIILMMPRYKTFEMPL